MPVPMMLAITMEHAVTKPIVRAGAGILTRRFSTVLVMLESTVAFQCIFNERTRVFLVFAWAFASWR